MADTSHSDPELARERFDSPEELDTKLDRLVSLIQGSKHCVAFTGAGISTSAGIHDFRGPDGKWTRLAQGLEPLRGTDTRRAIPTATHRALVALHRLGILKHTISQNCDGLHRRSGLPASAISELHGNSNVEVCESSACGRSYFRDQRCSRAERGRDHFTGRLCLHCGGRLLEYTIDFGQLLPELPLAAAQHHAGAADLHLVLGSSLSVAPASDLPSATAALGGAVVIVNLQRTALDDLAAIRIFARADTVMEGVMARLRLPIPPFTLRRSIIISRGAEGTVLVRSVDPDAPSEPVDHIEQVAWARPGHAAAAQVLPAVAAEYPEASEGDVVIPSSRVAGGFEARLSGVSSMRPILSFAGHYGEPPLQLNLPVPPPVAGGSAHITVEYEPVVGRQWSLTLQESLAGGEAADRPQCHPDYGTAHREYVIDGIMAQTARAGRELSRAGAASLVDTNFGRKRAAAAAAHDRLAA